MRERLYRFMQGRYGNDQFNKFLMVVMMICLVLSFFVGNAFYMVGLLLLIYVYFRMFSRNIYKRSAENQAYLRLRDRVTGFFRGKKSYGYGANTNRTFKDKTHRIFICSACKQKIRVPKGKGRIAIRCPKCGNEFVKRT
jgi:predicted RNA-binding Zn-ribbon protein involved in translation (DUF1610 family)